MELILLLPLLFSSQDKTSEVEKAIERTGKAVHFEYHVELRKKGGDLVLDGSFSNGVLWMKSGQGELVKDSSRIFVRVPGGEWQRPKGRKLASLGKFEDPRKFVIKLVGNVGAIKKEKSGRIGKVTVDIYVASASSERMTAAFESAGMPLWGSLRDWTKTSKGVLLYVERSTKLILRVEVRKGSERPSILLEFRRFHQARIPREVKEVLDSEP